MRREIFSGSSRIVRPQDIESGETQRPEALIKLEEVSRGWLTRFLVERGDMSGIQEAVEAGLACLPFLQYDTLGEFDTAFGPSSDDFFGHDETDRREIRELFVPEANEMNGRMMVFLMVANTFNRCDDALEIVLGTNRRNDDRAVGPGLLDGILENGLSGITTREGVTVRISPNEMLRHAKLIAQAVGIDVYRWDELLVEIIEAQKASMELLKQSRQAERIAYTVRQARQYRMKTVGNYAQILGQVVHDDLYYRNRFIGEMMEIQKVDDELDIVEDIGTQVNPFVALLAEFGLLGRYIRFYGMVAPGKNMRLLFFDIFLAFNFNLRFSNAVKRLREQYSPFTG